jgi:hypothetical protein
MMAGFTGYLSPQVLPGSPRVEAAATILRFVLLHVFLMPAATASLLCIIAWRNLRLVRRIAA